MKIKIEIELDTVRDREELEELLMIIDSLRNKDNEYDEEQIMGSFAQETFKDLIETSGDLGEAKFYIEKLLEIAKRVDTDSLSDFERYEYNSVLKSVDKFMTRKKKESDEAKVKLDELTSKWKSEV